MVRRRSPPWLVELGARRLSLVWSGSGVEDGRAVDDATSTVVVGARPRPSGSLGTSAPDSHDSSLRAECSR